MKKHLSLLLALCLLLTLVPVKAEAAVVSSGTCGENVQWSLDDQGTLTISGSGAMARWDRPGNTAVPWSLYQEDIISVVVEKGVTTIGSAAFADCQNLQTVSLPNTLTSIGMDAFYACSSLQYLEIPKSVTAIGFQAFRLCKSLLYIEIPEGVTKLESYTFMDCTNLLEVWLPESLEEMEFNIIYGCTSLQGLILPPNIKELSYTFGDTIGLEYLIFTGHAPVMNRSALSGIRGMVFYPINYKSWTREVLQECSGYMTWMGYESEDVPGPYLLQGSFANNGTWTLSADYTLTLSGMNDETESVPWKFYEERITHAVLEEGVTHVAPKAFWNHEKLREVSIPDSVTSIGAGGFYGCESLRGITLPDSVTEIGNSAFARCTRLFHIRMQAGLTSIGSNAFSESSVRYVELSEGLQSIPYGVFFQSGLQVINLPDGVQSIGMRAFCETNLQTIVIPASVTSIGTEVFVKCPLDSIYFLGDPPQFDDRAFVQVTTNAYYPADNPAWTEEVRQNYGGEITWIPCDHVHNYVAEVTLATCTTAGSATYTCADCGDSFVQPLDDALGHDIVEASCTQAKYCQNYGCGYTEGKPLGHNILPATCTMFGYCQNDYCGRIVSDPLGHQWDDANATVKTCTVCGEKEGYYRINLDPELVGETDYAWIDGVPYYLYNDGEYVFTALDHADATNLVLYYYNDLYAEDLHAQYPTGMKVWMLDCSSGDYEATYVKEFDDLLQYAGSSIRITGKKGIRMITSITKSNKQALTGKGLAGYKLVEYGTALAWVSDLADGHYLTLGEATTKSNYAYKRGVADPVFKDTGKLVQYTNVLVGFTNDQCAPDIAMRPYIIVEDASGKRVTIYGGTVYRSIAYIAYQNRNAFGPGTSSYEYVWSIIHHVYGNRFDQDYKN